MDRVGKQSLTDLLRIPPEIKKGEIRLTVTGNGRIWAENYKGILELSKDQLILRGNRLKVLIGGKNLCMEYFNKDELLVSGEIRRIQFDELERGN